MTKVMKKLSALLLTLALLFTMMPVLSIGAYAAEGDVLSVTVNGVEVGTVTSAWIDENMEEPQIFPFVTSKGNKWGYMIAEGPSYEALLMNALGVEDLSEYEEGDLVWTASDGVQDNPNNVLEVSELLGAKEQIGFEDQNGDVITGGFGSNFSEITTATAVKVPGAEGVTPILGTAQSKGTYPTYEKAAEALADGSWRNEATSEIRAYIGGNTGYKAVVKENGGDVDMRSPNITGKYSIGNVVSLDVRMPADVLSVTVDGAAAGTITEKWIAKNMEEPQIFPFVTSKGNKWGYMIAEGPSYEALLMKALGVEDLSEYEEGDLVWTASDGVQDNPNNVLEVSELLGAKEQIGFEDQNGDVITGGFGSDYSEITTATAVKVPGAEGVTPILGTAQSKGTYPTYEKAAEALADDSWRNEATSEIRAYIGGNTSYKAVVKENGGAVDMRSPNITGKYSIGNVVSLDVRMPADVLSVTLNGASAGVITEKWIAKNMEEPQIFPFVTSKGNKWGYMIAEGPSYEALLMKALGVEDLSDYEEGELVWTASDGVQDNPSNVLKVSELLGAKEQIGFEDQNGDVITGGFGSDYSEITTATAVKVPGAEGVTPILGTAQSKGTYPTYEKAAEALADDSWRNEATSEIRAYIGGNTSYKAVVKKKHDEESDAVVDMSSPNITGKYSIGNVVSLDVRFVPQIFKTSMTFTNKTAQTASVKYSDSFIERFGGLTWKTSNSKIAAVDKNGKVTPIGVGNCSVTATLGSGDVVVEVAVTVKESAFPQDKAVTTKKPATPKSFKVKNVKKKSAKLTWKKVSGASGYEIYRSTKKNKGFKKVKTISKGKTVKYVNKKLKKGKTYYYKIKAYKKVNGKKVYSKYTSVKKVKIKK